MTGARTLRIPRLVPERDEHDVGDVGGLVAGLPLAPVMSFWIASPTMDPEVFALSVGLIGWPLAVARLLATLLLG